MQKLNDCRNDDAVIFFQAYRFASAESQPRTQALPS